MACYRCAMRIIRWQPCAVGLALLAAATTVRAERLPLKAYGTADGLASHAGQLHRPHSRGFRGSADLRVEPLRRRGIHHLRRPPGPRQYPDQRFSRNLAWHVVAGHQAAASLGSRR